MQLAAKVVLVTQSRGHSRGSAARWRWNLLPLAQTRRSQRVADEVRACGRRAILVQADVTLIKQVQAMVSAVQEGLGPLDILINNAGMFPRVPRRSNVCTRTSSTAPS